MAPRKRQAENRDLRSIPNLYRKLDKRTNKYYFQYLNKITGAFLSLGTDEAAAKSKAKQYNAVIAAHLAAQNDNIDRIIQPKQPVGTPFSSWIEQYLKLSEQRFESGDLKLNSIKTKRQHCARLAAMFQTDIKSITVKDIAQQLNVLRDQGKDAMAQQLRSTLIDVFAEAIQAGEVDNNPAALTKAKTARVKRERLTLEVWQQVFEIATNLPYWVQNAMLLALVTGQRREDIALARFKKSADWEPAFIAARQKKPHPIKPYAFVDGDYLHVIQAKTGSMLKLPLDLRLDAINVSVGDVVSRCRKQAVSAYLIHHSKSIGERIKRGDPVNMRLISYHFSAALKKTGLHFEHPPTFHEQRSLSERLYRAQGIDTQVLLGHKNPETTLLYQDSRGAEWLEVKSK